MPLRPVVTRLSRRAVRLFRAQLSLLSACASGSAHEVVPLWADGAPGSEARRHEPEQADAWWVKNVHAPSLTVYLPGGFTERAAVIIMPGGGHAELVFHPEGTDPARFFNERGIAAFVLKYRLAAEPGSPYTVDVHGRMDAERALRLVRARASDWGIDPKRVGVMGWSAGAELAALVAYGSRSGGRGVDAIDRQSARPDFQIVVYPGPFGIPARLPRDAPPAFLIGAADDPGPADTLRLLEQRYRDAGLSVELHLYASGGHGFNMGERSELRAIQRWSEGLSHWLHDRGLAR